MHVEFKKPKFDGMGTPIKTKDQFWHAVLYGDNHHTLAYSLGKTKVVARENLQKEINSRLVAKLRKYTEMLNLVTKQEA